MAFSIICLVFLRQGLSLNGYRIPRFCLSLSPRSEVTGSCHAQVCTWALGSNSDLCVCTAYTFPAEPSSQSPHYLVLTYSCDPRDHIERSSVCFYFSMHKGGLCWHTDTWDIPHLVLKRPLLTDQAKAKRGPSGSGLFLLTQNKQI